MPVDLVIMALGNDANPIIKDSEPGLKTIEVGHDRASSTGSQETSLAGVYTGGDAARGGSTAIRAAGDGQAAAREIVGDDSVHCRRDQRTASDRAARYTELGQRQPDDRRQDRPGRAASWSSRCTRR